MGSSVAYFGFIVNLLQQMTVAEYYHFLSIRFDDTQTLAQIYLNICMFVHISNFWGLHIHAQFQKILQKISFQHPWKIPKCILFSMFSWRENPGICFFNWLKVVCGVSLDWCARGSYFNICRYMHYCCCSSPTTLFVKLYIWYLDNFFPNNYISIFEVK